jgi:hypothetical protein
MSDPAQAPSVAGLPYHGIGDGRDVLASCQCTDDAGINLVGGEV